jgi:hypothetical protein
VSLLTFQARDDLQTAAEDESVVTVTLDSGRIWTGTVRPHPTDPGFFVLRTGARGRPPKIHPEDVTDVIFE